MMRERKALVLRADDQPMSGVINHGPHQRYQNPRLTVETQMLGEIPDGFLRIQPIYVGICGTDVHLVSRDVHGYVCSSAPACIPHTGRVLGHEGVGRVLACGRGVQAFKAGDIVCLESIVVCYQCVACRSGFFNQCSQARILGTEADGLFATVADVPATVARRINEFERDADLRAAACLEPAGVALLACQRARICIGDHVLIFGGGPIGHFCAMLARVAMGAARITLIEPNVVRRDLASRWCDEVLSPDDELVHLKPDVVLEASGYLGNVQSVFRRIKANGRIVLLARSGSSLNLDALDHMISKNIEIQGVRGHVGSQFDHLLSMYRSRRLDLAYPATATLHSLEDLSAQLCKPDGIVQNNCKVLLRMPLEE